jgi:predicted RNase H-like nuclease (RuvC/YqgF family)
MKVMGVDIVKGSPLSQSNPPLYAVVVINEDLEVLYESIEVPLKGLIRVAWELKVDKIGIDNVFELAPTKKYLSKIFELLPANALVYQVTLENRMFIDVVKQAEKIGISISSKPKPLQTAYICALLALNNIGTVVRGVGSRAKIIVARARSPGSGGSRASIFARGMRTAILRAVKEIRKRLDEAQIYYDIILKRGRGGLESAVLVAYADIATVKRIVKPYHGNDIRVLVKPEFTTIEFVNEEYAKRPVIVGIDPGIETGVAVIDLSLKQCFTFSSKEFDKLSIINKVYALGTPVLIATDKNPPPESTKKIASMLGLQLYAPHKNLSIEDKEELINWAFKRGLTTEIKTSHERDALAAALKAYKAFEKKFIEVERRIIELGLDVDIDDIKLQILKGKTVNEAIEYAIEEHLKNLYYSNSNSTGHITSLFHNVTAAINCCEKVKLLEEKLNELVKERELLRKRVSELENKLQDIEFERKFETKGLIDIEVAKDRTISELKERIKQLQTHILALEDKLRGHVEERKNMSNLLKGIAKGELILVPVAKDIEPYKVIRIGEANAIFVLKNFIEMSELKKVEKPLILILNECLEEVVDKLLEFEVGIVCKKLQPLAIFDDIAVFSKNEVVEAVTKAYNELIEYKQRKRIMESLNLKKVKEIIEDYRRNLFKEDAQKS